MRSFVISVFTWLLAGIGVVAQHQPEAPLAGLLVLAAVREDVHVGVVVPGAGVADLLDARAVEVGEVLLDVGEPLLGVVVPSHPRLERHS